METMEIGLSWRKTQAKYDGGVDRAPKLWIEFHVKVEIKDDVLSGFFMAYCPANYTGGNQKEHAYVKFMSESYQQFSAVERCHQVSELRRCILSGKAALLLQATFPNQLSDLIFYQKSFPTKLQQRASQQFEKVQITSNIPTVPAEYLLWNDCLINTLCIICRGKRPNVDCGIICTSDVKFWPPLQSMAKHGSVSPRISLFLTSASCSTSCTLEKLTICLKK